MLTKRRLKNYLLLGAAGALYVWLFYNYFAMAQWHWAVIPVILLAWFSADFILGVNHFFLDYVGCPKGIGLKALTEHPDRSSSAYQKLKREAMRHLGFVERVAFDFKTHHIHPTALGHRSFPVLVAEPIMTHVLPVLIGLSVLHYFQMLNALAMLFFLVMSLGFLLGQYAHANTHKEVIPRPVQWLQATHIFLSIEHHNLHHDKFNRSFCILSGWADWIIDPLTRYLLQSRWLKRENLDLDY